MINDMFAVHGRRKNVTGSKSDKMFTDKGEISANLKNCVLSLLTGQQ